MFCWHLLGALLVPRESFVLGSTNFSLFAISYFNFSCYFTSSKAYINGAGFRILSIGLMPSFITPSKLEM